MPLPADFPDQHIQEDCAGSHPGPSRAGTLHEVVHESIALWNGIAVVDWPKHVVLPLP